ncbi:ribonuclease H family protein [uncultured Clostridium sp.]|uniref:ribonuclease H family protein n=1 Tax=uncultured Clostridium sp. TaxID=59620 RepID=UPI0025F7061C|nr:ribonuclease H family protein [uncultured Clostridium sp.]
MAKKNYYAVKVGFKTGIFRSWEECSKYVKGYPGAKYKGFATLAEAEAFMNGSRVEASSKSIKSTRAENDKVYKVDLKRFNSETKTYYVVCCGRRVGIFETWKECEEQVKGYPNAKHKKVIGKSQALEYLREGNIKVIEENVKLKNVKKVSKKNNNKSNKIGYDVEPIKSKADVKSSKAYIEPSKIKDKFKYIAFIDGSYDKRSKIYGSGVIVLKDNLIEYEEFYEAGYDEWDQWNIVGELEATKLALKKAEEIGAKNIAIYHDLKNISLWATGEWKAKNRYTQEYVKFIEEYSTRLNIYFIKVKAHSSESIYNDLADEAAKKAIIQYVS